MLFSIILIATVWCVLSESFLLLDWLTGLTLGAAAWFASHKLLPAPHSQARLRPLPISRFLLVAFFGMFPAAARLAPLVLQGKAHASESVIHLKLRHPLTRLLLCGAITMSPGTISARIQHDTLHILTLLPVGKPVVISGSQSAEHLQSLLLPAERPRSARMPAERSR